MNYSHGFCHRAISLATILSFFIGVLPARSLGEEPSKYDQVEELNKETPDLTFKNDKTYYGHLSDSAYKIYEDPILFWPTLVMTVVPTAVWYRLRWIEAAKAVDVHLEALKRHSPDYAPELARLTERRKAATQNLGELLKTAKKSEYEAIMKRLPAESKSQILADFKEKGIKLTNKDAATSMEQLLGGLQDFHEINKQEFALLKNLASDIEKRLGLPPGTITRKLQDPDKFLSEGYGIATKRANPKAFTTELVRYENAIRRQATLKGFTFAAPAAAADGVGWLPQIPKWAPKNVPFTKLKMIPWWQVHLFDNKTALVIRSTIRRGLRVTMPILVVGSVVVGGHMLEQSFAAAQKEAKDLEDLDKLSDQKEDELFLKSMTLEEDALALIVENLWQNLQDRYGDKGFVTKSPFRPGDPKSRELISMAYQTVALQFRQAKEDPRKKSEEDKAAREYLIKIAEKLGMTAPPEDSTLSMKFFRAFWMELLAKAEEMPGAEDLKNIPATRDLSGERLYGVERPLVTKQELVHDLAMRSPSALLMVRQTLENFRKLGDQLSKIAPDKQIEFLTETSKIDPTLAHNFALHIQYKKDLEEEARREEKDPLPLPTFAPAPDNKEVPATPEPEK